MRIDILDSAKRHSITEVEIRTVVSFPELRYGLIGRLAGVDTSPVLHIGRPAPNEPHLEVIADLIIPDITVVFHAMMLRPSLVQSLGIDLLPIEFEYAPQRS